MREMLHPSGFIAVFSYTNFPKFHRNYWSYSRCTSGAHARCPCLLITRYNEMRCYLFQSNELWLWLNHNLTTVQPHTAYAPCTHLLPSNAAVILRRIFIALLHSALAVQMHFIFDSDCHVLIKISSFYIIIARIVRGYKWDHNNATFSNNPSGRVCVFVCVLCARVRVCEKWNKINKRHRLA